MRLDDLPPVNPSLIKAMERQANEYRREYEREMMQKFLEAQYRQIYRYQPVEAPPSEPALDAQHEAFVSRVLARIRRDS